MELENGEWRIPVIGVQFSPSLVCGRCWATSWAIGVRVLGFVHHGVVHQLSGEGTQHFSRGGIEVIIIDN